MATSAPVVAAATTLPMTTPGEVGCGCTLQSKRRSPLDSSGLDRPRLIRILPAMHAVVRTATILVVEDSPDLVALLQRVLREQHFVVRSARDGESGLASAIENEPDLLILDVGLPKRDGFEVIQELRKRGITAPTLMLTARSRVADRVSGLEAGADDYLVKPFDPDELVARVRALLRRSAAHGRVPLLCVGDLVLDPITREVSRGGRPLVLTHREF